MELNFNMFAGPFLRSKNKSDVEVDEQIRRNSQGVSQEEEAIIAATNNAYAGGSAGFGGEFSSSQTAFRSIFANKSQKVSTYREMSYFPEIVDALNTICDEAITPDENGNFVKLKIKKEIPLREEKHIRKVWEYIISDVLKFDKRGWQLFRTWLVDSELFVEKILNDKGSRIIGIKVLPCTNTYPVYENDVIRKYVQTTQKVKNYNLNRTTTETSFAPEQVCYLNYGQYGTNRLDVRGYLEASIRTWNQLRNLEDALLIYRLVRAPERRLWNVEVGRLPPGKAEEFMKNLIARYKKDFTYNSETGTVDSQKLFQALTHDYWFAKREGQGTEVTTLQSGMNLGELNDVNLFLTKLYKTLQIPKSRWEDTMNTVASNMAPGEITREEVKFSRMITRLRGEFKKLFLDLLTTQLRLANQIDQKYTRDSLFDVDFCEDNVFAEQKHLLNLKSRFEVISMVTADIANKDNPNGLWSKKYVLTEFFGMDENEYQRLQTMIREEIDEQMSSEPATDETATDEAPTDEIGTDTGAEETSEPFTPKGGKQTLSTKREEGGAEEAPNAPGLVGTEPGGNQEGTGETSANPFDV